MGTLPTTKYLSERAGGAKCVTCNKKSRHFEKHLNGAIYIADVAILKRESIGCRSEGDLEFDIEMCLPRHRHDVGEFAHQPATAPTTTC